jgi:hypothetical protein
LKNYDYANAFTTDDYKSKFRAITDDLFARAKRGEPELADRSKRMKLIEDLTEAYVTQTGERPDPTQLDRLATLILREELTDTDSHKMRHNEYPVMSDTQLARRKDGVHQRNNGVVFRETSFDKLQDYGTDGRDHAKPIRRLQQVNEQIEVEAVARSRDKERRRKYNEFIKRQPVITYKRGEVNGD